MLKAYASIHWSSLILIIGMMPFLIALQKTGGVNLIVDFMIETVGVTGKHWILIFLFMISAVIGLFISNTATAILMAPIAITLAQHLNVPPTPFAMTVAIGAVTFMTCRFSAVIMVLVRIIALAILLKSVSHLPF